MASPSDVLQQLNDKLFTKQYAKKPEVELDLDESQATKGRDPGRTGRIERRTLWRKNTPGKPKT